MILKLNGTLFKLLDQGESNVFGASVYSCVILYNDTIVNDSYEGIAAISAIHFKSRSLEDNIIHIPLPGFFHGIYQWRSLLIHTPGLSIGIGFISKIVQHLDFIKTMYVYPAVAS